MTDLAEQVRVLREALIKMLEETDGCPMGIGLELAGGER